MEIAVEDVTRPDIVQLLREHLQSASQHSPPESVHALDPVGLRDPSITFWTARDGPELLGCCALRELDPMHGEIKSMRTAESHLCKGVANTLMQHLLAEAGRRGYERLSLETGSAQAFAPARKLYAKFGFEPCPAFATYVSDPYSVFMSRSLPTSPIT